MTSPLFPLPLTPFERYYLADDRPDYPTVFPIQLELAGRADRATFERALAATMARHPLLAAKVVDMRGGLQWVPANDLVPAIDWAEEPTPIGHADGERIDLRRDAGLRVWVRVGESSTRLLCEFHHAACDGIAGFQFLEDLLVQYALAANDSVATPAPAKTERLRDRAEFDVGPAPPRRWWSGLHDLVVAARVFGRILFRSCAVLAGPPHNGPPAPRQPFLGYESIDLDQQQTTRLAEAARSRGMTVNDLLLTDMFTALDDWRKTHAQRRNQPLRIMVPVYVRGRAQQDIPASNGIGFAFVTVPTSTVDDRSALVAEVHEQMEQIKNWKLALYFLGGLAAAGSIKPLVPWMLNRSKPFATLVLSNLGRSFARTPLERDDGLLVAGGLKLVRISGVPPVRPLTHGSIAVVEYAGRTTIILRCDPLYFTAADTRALLEMYARRLQETLAI